MSPEQMDAPQSVDHRSDIYSAEVILYELLTGELPTGNFAPPSQKGRGDSHLDETVMRALAREPERRFQSIADFRVQLARADSQRPPVVRTGWPIGDDDQLNLVAKGIILVAAFQWFVANVFLLFFLLFVDWNESLSIWAAATLASGVFGASMGLFGGMRMLRRESYWFSVAACASSIACFPANIAGLPLGILGLSILWRDDVRQQFPRQAKDDKSAGTSMLLLTSSVINLLMFPMFVTLPWLVQWLEYPSWSSGWMMIFGVSSVAGIIQLATFGLSRTRVLRPLICLILVAGLFTPATGWVAAVFALVQSVPILWRWRVFAWLRDTWSELAIGIVGLAILCAATAGGSCLLYQSLVDELPGTYQISEHTYYRGAEPRSKAFAELKFEATTIATTSVQYGQHPGLQQSLNRAAFSDPQASFRREFTPPPALFPAFVLVSIAIGLILNLLWIRFVYRRARLKRPPRETIELPRTQFSHDKGK